MNTEIRNGILYIIGDVTVKTVNSTNFSLFSQQCRLKEISKLDLSHIGSSDSVCISLLLTAIRSKSEKWMFFNIPESVQALADLYDIKDWINQ